VAPRLKLAAVEGVALSADLPDDVRRAEPRGVLDRLAHIVGAAVIPARDPQGPHAVTALRGGGGGRRPDNRRAREQTEREKVNEVAHAEILLPTAFRRAGCRGSTHQGVRTSSVGIPGRAATVNCTARRRSFATPADHARGGRGGVWKRVRESPS